MLIGVRVAWILKKHYFNIANLNDTSPAFPEKLAIIFLFSSSYIALIDPVCGIVEKEVLGCAKRHMFPVHRYGVHDGWIDGDRPNGALLSRKINLVGNPCWYR